MKEQLMPIACHPTKMQYWCMAEDENKRIQGMLTQEKRGCSWSLGEYQIVDFDHLICRTKKSNDGFKNV